MNAQPQRDVDALERRAAILEAKADAVLRAYNRATWIRFVLVFFPVPFVVVLFRLELDAWHYYVAGALTIGFAAALVALDGAAAARRDAAAAEAERARSDCEEARTGV